MRLEEELVAASSVPLVLSILSEGDSYGYAIIQRVKELSGAQIEWTATQRHPAPPALPAPASPRRDQHPVPHPHPQRLQAPGAGLRGAGAAGLLGAQPLGLVPHSGG